MDSKNLGNRVRQVRKSKNMTQTEFGFKLGISHSHVSNIENGKENASNTLVLMMCSTFQIDREWLLFGEGEMHASRLDSEDVNERFEYNISLYKQLFEQAQSFVKKEQYNQIIANIHVSLVDDSYWYTNNMDVEPWRFNHMTHYLEILSVITNLIECVRNALNDNNKNAYKQLYDMHREHTKTCDIIKESLQKLVSNMCNDENIDFY